MPQTRFLVRNTAFIGSERPDELVAYACDLEQHDAAVAARAENAGELLRRVDVVTTRAALVRRALAVLPEEIDLAEQAVIEAQKREEEARRDAVEAESRLRHVQSSKRSGDDAREVAGRGVRRAEVLVAVAGDAVVRQQERLRVALSSRVTLRVEAGRLVVEACSVACDLAGLPGISDSGRRSPGASLDELEQWGARAHAAIFVVRAGLERERECILLEASALAASALGVQGAGVSVALVRRRLEQALGQS